MVGKVAVVIGMGPGLGAALIRRFCREGYAVAGLARSVEKCAELKKEGETHGWKLLMLSTDATDEAAMASTFKTIREELGEPEVLIYNAGAFKIAGVMEVSSEEFMNCWKINCHGAFLGAKEVLPAMVAAGRGTILLTSATAALRGSARFSCLAVGKFGLRALAQSMAREYGPSGVHVASMVIDGMIDTLPVPGMFGAEGPRLQPEAIAESYWQVHVQDRSAWTQELDLRPYNEKF